MNSIAEATQQNLDIPIHSRKWIVVSAFLVSLPALFFFAVLFSSALDIPFFDDYDGVLDFTNQLSHIHGWPAKLYSFLTAQHNEYKLPFSQGLAYLQFLVTGHVDFRLLDAMGNSLVLCLGFVLWKMFLPGQRDLGLRLALFVPVSLLLFEFRYRELLNWGGAAMQHLGVLVFAFAAMHLIFKRSMVGFYGAMFCYVLAIASSGNGFFLLPIGLLILVSSRSYLRALLWLLTSVLCILGYAYHYNTMSSQASPDGSILSAILRLRPIYVLSFIGSAASVPFHWLSFLLGAMFLIFFGWMGYRGYYRKNPPVACCLLFIGLTAIGVAGIRSDLGLEQSLSPRYAIYSVLLLIFAWYAAVQEFGLDRDRSVTQRNLYRVVVAACLCFSLFMDAAEIPVIRSNNRNLVLGMAMFEHSVNSSTSTSGPVLPLWAGDTARVQANPRARVVLIESMRLGVYRPPVL
jgi:hypothetical protein